MKKKSNTIVFFGTEDFSLESLKALVENEFSIACVVTKPDTKRGRGHTLTQPAVKQCALAHNIPVLQPQKIADIKDTLRDYASTTGVLVSYGKIIPQSIIDIFENGIINVHPSLLPLYRGPTPIESAIINRDSVTGVTIMQLTAKMDAGGIYAQIQHTLDKTETQSQLYETLSKKGADLLVETLPNIINQHITATPQDETKAVYCNLLTRELCFFDPDTLTAKQLEAKFRAHAVFPRTKYHYQDQLLTILNGHADTKKSTDIDIVCKEGVFVVDTVLSPHGKTMNAEAFLRGIKK